MTLTVVPPLPLTPLSIQAPALPRRRVYSGDSLWVLAHLMPDSLDALVCDPPAGIEFMAKDWDSFKGDARQVVADSEAKQFGRSKVRYGTSAGYGNDVRQARDNFIASLTPLFHQCLRVLKPGAHGLVWALPRTSHWTAIALEEAGFEIRDLFQHWFGSGFPKSMDISKAIDKAAGATREVVGERDTLKGQGGEGNDFLVGSTERTVELTAAATEDAKRWEGWGTALKPAVERWILCRKPFANNAESGLSSSHPGSSEESAFAHAHVETRERLSSLARSVQTATFSSPEVGSTVLSIVSSWQNCLAVLWNARSTFTTAMAIRTTIDLRILNYCLSEITPDTTILAGISANGEPSPASVAALLFSALKKLCESTSFARADASSEAPISGQPFDNRQASASAPRQVPSANDIILVRKPLNGSVVENVLALGTGALNIDASRVATGDALVRPPIRHDGTQSINAGLGVGAQIEPGGRWPSHLLLTHAASCRRVGSKVVKATTEPVTMDESEFDAVPVAGVEEVAVFECDPSCPIRRLDEQTGDLHSQDPATRLSRSKAVGITAMGTGRSVEYADTGGASRFFQTFEQEPDPFLYAAKASRSDKGTGNVHPTVKSTKLMEYLIRMVTPPGGTVLDPFGGSGTTAVAAARLGFGYVLCEREPQYLDIICQRLQVERSTVMSLRLIQGGAVPPVPAPPPRNFLVVHPKGLSEDEMHALWTQIGQALIPASGGQPFELTMALADWRVNFEKAGGWQEWINAVVGRGFASGSYRYAGFVVAGRVLGQASAEIVKLALIRRAPVVIYEPGEPLRVASRVYAISADWREGFRVD